MGYKRALTRRIIIAFMAIALVVGGSFSLMLVYVVHRVEEQLVADELSAELNHLLSLSSNEADKWTDMLLRENTHFYTSAAGGPDIPAALLASEEGFTEFIDDAEAYYIFQLTRDGLRHLLVKEQHDFEQREQALFSGVLGGFIFSVLAASVLGWILARRVMAPVARLARQVRHRDQLLPMAPALAPNYADDEVGQLAAAFDTTVGFLRQALERERFFTSDVSHELRTPLMVISSSCELLFETAGLSSPQQQKLRQIQTAASQILELVETFLLLARGNSQDDKTAAQVSLASTAEEAIQRFTPTADNKGLRLVMVEEAGDGGTYNARFLAVVMANLLSNAVHYTDAGEIRLVLTNREFRVEDSGIGVPAVRKLDVFEPFIRVDHARGEGQGLGLSIVQRICEHQDWRINLRALDPVGSCFTVSL